MKTAVHGHFHVLNPPTPPMVVPIWKQGARMHLVTRAPFDTATRQFPNQALALDDLYRIQKRSTTRHQTTCESSYLAWLDEISVKMVVSDVGGGHLRVMFFADFERGKIFIKHISTHAEYDKLTDLYRRTKE
ncbi:type II toxin-antitoxin system HigB family toxin [Enterobacter kobei]|uniref:type II toxin-antitoxin system HigB family toxin n=1 Tax=Enterobacter kobei TaxID=208224 RepID=UPI002005C647|nr:type II toxin-antitoxin system HigB family toxin [Enterobacter kobei]MCK7348712.1 type II toxin-antitoxin system HigB family toxin [Enterobacter kobei]